MDPILQIKTPIPPTQAKGLLNAFFQKRLSFFDLLLPGESPADPYPDPSYKRSYTPMDHCYPPNCPYSDEYAYHFDFNHATIDIRANENYWNERELANSGFRFVFAKDGLTTIFAAAESSGTTAPDYLSWSFYRMDEPAAKLLHDQLMLILKK